jgi:hypothetical protein
MKTLMFIDDNEVWLQNLLKKGFQVHYCPSNDSLDNIIQNVKESISENIDIIFINVSLICNKSERRLDYGGFSLFKRLVIHLKCNHWYLVSFEDSKKLEGRLPNFLNYSGVSIIDYLQLTKSIQNEKQT